MTLWAALLPLTALLMALTIGRKKRLSGPLFPHKQQIAPGRDSVPGLLLLPDFFGGQLRCFFLPSSRAAAASRETEAAASHRAV